MINIYARACLSRTNLWQITHTSVHQAVTEIIYLQRWHVCTNYGLEDNDNCADKHNITASAPMTTAAIS